jgi:hypothetical protein
MFEGLEVSEVITCAVGDLIYVLRVYAFTTLDLHQCGGIVLYSLLAVRFHHGSE